MFQAVKWFRAMSLSLALVVGFAGIGFGQDEMNPYDMIPSRHLIFNTDLFLLKGPVQEMRSEYGGFTIDFTTLGWVEDIRRLDSVCRFDAEGYLLEEEDYEMSGILVEKRVYQREGALVVLQSLYDPAGNLLRTYEYTHTPEGVLAEERMKSAGGVLLERWEYTYSDTETKVLHYDADGELLDRLEALIQDTTIDSRIYDGEGNLEERTVMTKTGNQQEMIAYDGNEEFVTRVIQYLDDNHKLLESHAFDEEGILVAKSIYKYEDYDAYGNWRKQTSSMAFLAEEEGEEDFEYLMDVDMELIPVSVEYRQITYHTTGIQDFSIY